MPVTVRMSTTAYSAAAARADIERRNVQDVMRAALRRYLADPEDEQDA
jgi:hypothetical protein